jgi:hypothetical protein
MAQSAPSISLLRQGVEPASQCGDPNAYACVKIVNPYDCNVPESYEIEVVAALTVASTSATLFVSATPAGAPAPTVADPFYLYQGTVLTFNPGGTPVEVKVLQTVALNSLVAGVPVAIEPPAAAVAAASNADLYRFHVLEGIQGVNAQANDESEDTTKNKDGIQKSESVVSRGITYSLTTFLNKNDRGLWTTAKKLLTNGGQDGFISVYGLPGLFDVGMGTFMNGSIDRQAKSKAKMSFDVMLNAPYNQFSLYSTETPARQALLAEAARLWGYSLQNDFIG